MTPKPQGLITHDPRSITNPSDLGETPNPKLQTPNDQ